MGKIVCVGDKVTVHCSGGGSHPHGIREAVVTQIIPSKISTLTTVNGKKVAHVGAKVQATCFDTGVIKPRTSFGTDQGEVIATTDCPIGVGTPWDGNNGDRIDYLVAWNYSYNDVNVVQ